MAHICKTYIDLNSGSYKVTTLPSFNLTITVLFTATKPAGCWDFGLPGLCTFEPCCALSDPRGQERRTNRSQLSLIVLKIRFWNQGLRNRVNLNVLKIYFSMIFYDLSVSRNIFSTVEKRQFDAFGTDELT